MDREATRRARLCRQARRYPDRIADPASSWTLPDIDGRLLSEPRPSSTPAPTPAREDEDDALQADAGEAPSGSSLSKGSEERRSEMDERTTAGPAAGLEPALRIASCAEASGSRLGAAPCS